MPVHRLARRSRVNDNRAPLCPKDELAICIACSTSTAFRVITPGRNCRCGADAEKWWPIIKEAGIKAQ
jgi:hypothetical protein